MEKVNVNYKCDCCGIDMYAKPSRIQRTKRICCSRDCSSQLRKEYMAGERNHQFGLKGEDNPTFSGRKRRVRDGYVSIRDYSHPFAQENGWVLEHRIVAEQCLLDEKNSITIGDKRYLKPELVVHHKDLNKKNNKEDNLEVVTLEEHTRIHNLLDPAPRDMKTGRFIKKEVRT